MSEGNYRTKITLREALETEPITDLRKMAKAKGLKGYTKKTKDELIKDISVSVLEKEFFEYLILVLNKEAWSLYKEVVKKGYMRTLGVNPIDFAVMGSMSYLYVEEQNEKVCLIIPEEVKPLYNELVEDGILERKARHDLINYYARAAVNLYGVIRQEELASIFNSQNKEALTENEMFDALLKQIYFYSNYCFWEDYIVHDEFEDGDFKEVSMLLNEIGNKPRYIPVKEEFLRYADDDYFEKTKEIQALRAFFIKESGVDASVADEILIEIHYAFLVQTGLQEVFDILENYNVFIDENKLNKLVELITQCSNNTRLWENNGHTPNELFKINKKRLIQATSNNNKIEKIGRNDPCPCGSGKKYKKCCGKAKGN